MNLADIPFDPIERRGFFFSESAKSIISQSQDFIKNAYPQVGLIEECIAFVETDIIDSWRSDNLTLGRTWFFPISEVHDELEAAFVTALAGMYKSVYDHLRRALEITIVGSYFLQDHITQDEANAWFRSDNETPPFSRALRNLSSKGRFLNLETNCGWATKVREWYWKLSDSIHTKGIKYSIRSMQPTAATFNGIPVFRFSEKQFTRCLNLYITTIRHICVCRAAENPIILIGLPIDDKFGLNPPISGFFDEKQARSLWQLLFDTTKPTFEEIIQNDDEVFSLKQWFAGLPDLTDEQLQKQADEQEKWFKAEQE